MPHKLSNNLRFRILGNMTEISEMLGIDGKVLGQPPKKQTLTVVLQNLGKSAAKHSNEKPMLLNFLNLSTIFSPMLPEERYFHL